MTVTSTAIKTQNAVGAAGKHIPIIDILLLIDMLQRNCHAKQSSPMERFAAIQLMLRSGPVG